MKQFNPAELSPAGGSQEIRAGDRWITVEIQPHLYGLYFCQSQRCEGRQCNRNMHAVERES